MSAMQLAEAIDLIVRSGNWTRPQILALLSEKARFAVPPAEVGPATVEAVESGCSFPLNHVRARLGMARSPFGRDAALAALGDPDAAGPIIAAIRKLDSTDAALWTKGGAPRVDAIEAVLGRDITMAERDAAWESLQDASRAI